jgi:hypothetical protein
MLFIPYCLPESLSRGYARLLHLLLCCMSQTFHILAIIAVSVCLCYTSFRALFRIMSSTFYRVAIHQGLVDLVVGLSLGSFKQSMAYLSSSLSSMRCTTYSLLRQELYFIVV